jgi:hypothetical protein
MVAQPTESREEAEERVIFLHLGVKAQDLIQLFQPGSEVRLAGRHTHLVHENKENVRSIYHRALLIEVLTVTGSRCYCWAVAELYL